MYFLLEKNKSNRFNFLFNNKYKFNILFLFTLKKVLYYKIIKLNRKIKPYIIGLTGRNTLLI